MPLDPSLQEDEAGDQRAPQRFQRRSALITANLKTHPLKTHLLLPFPSFLSPSPISLIPASCNPSQRDHLYQVLVLASMSMETQAKTDRFLLTLEHVGPALVATSNSSPGLFS